MCFIDPEEGFVESLFAVASVVAWVVLAGAAEFANSYGRRELQREKPDMREAAKWYQLRSRFSLPFVLMSAVAGWWIFRMAPGQWLALLIIFGGAATLGAYNMATMKRRLRVPDRKSNWPPSRIFGKVVESPVGWSDRH